MSQVTLDELFTRRKVSTGLVYPNDYNPNQMSETEFEGLVASLQATGLKFLEKDPILVRPVNGQFEIVDGEHRWKACNQLEFAEVWIDIEEMSLEEATRRCVIKNKDRGQLNYFRLSKLLNKQWKRYSHSGNKQDELGQDYGLSQSMISLILPIYTKLKMYLPVNTFSNKALINLARIQNEFFLQAVFQFAKDKEKNTAWIQDKATLCNAISKYIEEQAEEKDWEVSEAEYETIIPALLKHEDEHAVKATVDELLGKPVCYLPTILLGDAVKQLKTIENTSVGFIVTSPPYGNLKDYEHENQITAHASYEEYLERLLLVWRECKRVLMDGGRLCINIGDEFLATRPPYPHTVRPIHADFIKQCQYLELDYMGTILWQKAKTRNPSGGGAVIGSYLYPTEVLLEYDFEFILIFRKPGHRESQEPHLKEASKFTKEEWTALTSSAIWQFPGERKHLHPAPFPLELPTRLIKMFSFKGDLVLDPFVGSGTTLLAAMQLGRRSIGTDLHPDFVETANNRINEWRQENSDSFRFTETA